MSFGCRDTAEPPKWWCRWCDQYLPCPPCGPLEEVKTCKRRKRKMSLDAGVPTDAPFKAQFEDHPPIKFAMKPPPVDDRMPVSEVKDMVTLPSHYKRFKIEPIYFIQENELTPLQGKVVKYVVRYPFKNGVEDLRKAKRCCEMLIAKETGDPDWWKDPKEKA